MYAIKERITVVTRETRLQGLVQRQGTRGMAKFLFKKGLMDAQVQKGQLELAAQTNKADTLQEFADMELEAEQYNFAEQSITKDLDLGIPVQVVPRQYVSNYDFGLSAAVVVLGQDGLVANTAKYAGDVPIIGVNPDPARFDGILLPFQVNEVREAVSLVLNKRAKVAEVTLGSATLHDGQTLLAFNDFFVGVKSHVSARYRLKVGSKQEEQSSSGLLVSTGAGSTGWMSSIFNMAQGVTRMLGKEPPEPPGKLPWNDRRLIWAVREPFESRTTGVKLVAGMLQPNEELEIQSLISDGGVIFSDGIESDFLEFNGGSIVRIAAASQRARLVVR